MSLPRLASELLLRVPLVRPAARNAYRAGHRVLDKARLTKQNLLPATCISPSDTPSFFGYYDKSPWDPSGRYLLFLTADFDDRMPAPNDVARVCVVDSWNPNSIRVIGYTRSWCWQQGAMLQWLGETSTIVFNDFEEGQYISRVVDIDGKYCRTLPRPVYAVSKDGTQALSMDFERIHFARPGYGYVSKPLSGRLSEKPPDNGVWWMDTLRGDAKLIISLEQLAEFQKENHPDRTFHYVLHAEFNPNGTRFVFLHRWFQQEEVAHNKRHVTRLYTADPDGHGLYLLEDSGFTSHFTWKDDEHLLATSARPDLGFNYHLYRDMSNDVSILGKGVLTGDGHPSFSPDGRWLLTDTYPDRVDKRTLILYDLLHSRRVDLGSYRVPPVYSGPLRCDLHPRWSRDGNLVCFDSVHDRIRGVYVLDVSSVTGYKV